MRRSASETIRNLEDRIARLEGKTAKINLKSLAKHISKKRSDGTGTVGFVEYDARSQTVIFLNGDYEDIVVPVDKLLAQLIREEMGNDLYDLEGNTIS
jgi:hypothetical protein